MFCCCLLLMGTLTQEHPWQTFIPHQNLAFLPGQERGSQVPRLCNVFLTSKRHRGPCTGSISAPSLCYRPVSLHPGTKNLNLSPHTCTVKILPNWFISLVPPVTKICVLKGHNSQRDDMRRQRIWEVIRSWWWSHCEWNSGHSFMRVPRELSWVIYHAATHKENSIHQRESTFSGCRTQQRFNHGLNNL